MRGWTLALIAPALAAHGARAQQARPAARPAESQPAASQPLATPCFRETTLEWGLRFAHVAGATPEKHLPETMGGGAALFDADGDGDLDVYCVQSGPLPVGSASVRSAEMPPNQLFLNRGAGQLRDATGESGAAADRGYGQGCCAGDVDGDADLDLYVTNFGPDVLLANDGHARYADVTKAAGVGDDRWTAGASFFDADNDGDLDLYVTAYVQIDVDHPSWCGRKEPGLRMYCHPDEYPRQQDRFWRNQGDGTFTDATETAGMDGHPGKGLGAIAGDFDADGDLDVYVAHDSVENFYWTNTGDGTFEDSTLISGTGVNGSGTTEASMGLASGDYDGDLDLDLLVTALDDESTTLYRNDGDGLYSDVSAPAGLEAATRPFVGFGIVLEDFDLDGDLDVFQLNGHIIDNIDKYFDHKSWRQRPQLFVNGGKGRFREARAELGPLDAERLIGRGAYSGDLDGDGRPDLLVMQCGDRARVWRNESGGRALVLRGLPRGTQVVATLSDGRQILREASAQPSYYGQSAEEIYLGLGADAALKSLELRLLGGKRETLPFDPPRGPGALVLERGNEGWKPR